jgi:hypothetical protein
MLDALADGMTNKPVLTNSDWIEIYYAVLFKLRKLPVRSAKTEGYYQSLERVLKTLGTGGEKMFD